MLPEKHYIFLIEDNPADALLVERALATTPLSYEIGCFQDGADALAALLAVEGPDDVPDLILLDLKMPRIDGLHILQQIRATPKLTGIPVGILTGSVSPGDEQRALTLGAARYIHKSASFDAFSSGLNQAVAEMLQERDMSALGGIMAPDGYARRLSLTTAPGSAGD